MQAPQYKTRAQMWHAYLAMARNEDVFAEFGVWNGRSINYMADVRPDNTFHAFDSFEGLPEEWNKAHPKGHFATDLAKLKFHSNVVVHPGWFDATIPAFDATGLRFLHIDCDIKSSTDTVLRLLEKPILSNRAVLLFDEFYNYTGFEDHEFLAFLEFVERTGCTFQVLGRNINHQQVMIQIA